MRTDLPVGEKTRFDQRARVALVWVECVLVLALLVVWLTSEGVRESNSLHVLFWYSFPSEFLVGLVPHEPALIYFGAHHPVWLVTLVATVGTVLAEALNYSVFSLVYERPSVQSISRTRSVAKLIELFGRRPFTAILVAGFTPVPFFPVRFLVVMTAYSRTRYLLGVALSRAPRFWILAALGAVVAIPVRLLTALFVVMLLSVNVPTLLQVLGGRGASGREPGLTDPASQRPAVPPIPVMEAVPTPEAGE